MYKLSFRRYIIGFFIALRCGEMSDYIKYFIMKSCPRCGNKMHKNLLGNYNCGKCFTEYCNAQGI